MGKTDLMATEVPEVMEVGSCLAVMEAKVAKAEVNFRAEKS